MGKAKKKSAQGETVNLSLAEKILDKYRGEDGCLIPVLQNIQNEYGYLQESVINLVSERLNMSLSEVMGVASFFAQFHLKPRGKHIIKVCTGTACHVKKAKGLSAKVIDRLKINANETTKDLMFTFEEVACLGACGIAPVVVVNKDVHGTLSPDKLGDVLDGYAKSLA
ncbi:MAG: NAD(P)H-dependent oxidoreductase subunit E [Candidatus Scalindua sp.]|jgi:NADH-quinone oxidoreductase subunit E|nr:NAD(P)H-dependent oxidoreductase subunit E [Candidatus Scalindua sp.]